MPATFAAEIRWYLDMLSAPLADDESIRDRAEKLNAMARKLGVVVE